MFSCKDSGVDFGNYIEGNYQDEIRFTSDRDSINLVIEQLGSLRKVKESIPYSVQNSYWFSDTIVCDLFVSYGNYDTRPKVYKEIISEQDTIFLWYSFRKRENFVFKNIKTTSENSIMTSPKSSYTSIDSMVIKKSANKKINLITRLIN